MGRSLGILGILASIVIIAGAAVFLVLFISDSEFTNNLIETSFCHEDETLRRKEQQTVNTDRQSATRLTYYCSDNRTGEEREITDQTAYAAIAGFGLPLCFGIFLGIGGSALLKASMTKQKPAQFTTFTGQPMNVQQFPANLQIHFSQESYTAEEVEERLRQLQEMLNAGTLSQEQYFTIEQELRSRQRY